MVLDIHNCFSVIISQNGHYCSGVSDDSYITDFELTICTHNKIIIVPCHLSFILFRIKVNSLNRYVFVIIYRQTVNNNTHYYYYYYYA